MPHTIKSLHIYPVKSLGGIQVNSAYAEPLGFKNDRRMMLIDSTGRFLSQREFPKLALFDCTLSSDTLTINYNDHKIDCPLDASCIAEVDSSVWQSHLTTGVVNNEINNWFSDLLGQDIRFVKMTSASIRKKKFLKKPYSSHVSLADGYPYLIIGTASLDELNDKLDIPVPMNRFRPNIVIESTSAHQEDLYSSFKGDEASFINIKPCARCIMTTIDQSTSDKGVEPLKTLSGYRKKANKIYFGTNLILDSPGQLHVGEKLEAK